ncbi:putative transcription factor MYB/SANT family [Rosa chinensis]|uniref:Putative transcription factor MYB/SANT family n=1 Tax=Rosa chinensis TaxID=74649 RepID=A0A2P6R9B0_ROSCH|nr:transcription factor DIVARICATA [Rosa chinensis]PRQ43006.1 putative transcription factor MYB/SANT family [Rosa chinensis]
MYRGIEVLSPASYLQTSNWLFQESKGAEWTAEENKRFENALALYDKDTPDRWHKVASWIPGKTVGDVIKQYKELEEDVSDIEAGLIPIPGYSSNNSFTLEWADDQGFDGLKQYYSTVGGKRGSSTRPSEQERKKGVPWTEEEHRQFLMGLKKYGKGDWRNISRNFVTSRTPTQVASHAQKYYIRQLTGGKDKRRSSIHDITTVNLSDTKSGSQESNQSNTKSPPSQDHDSAVAVQSQQHAKVSNKQQFDWKVSKEGPQMVFNSMNGNAIIGPFFGISSHVPKIEEQDFFIGSTFHGSQFDHHNVRFEMQYQ